MSQILAPKPGRLDSGSWNCVEYVAARMNLDLADPADAASLVSPVLGWAEDTQRSLIQAVRRGFGSVAWLAPALAFLAPAAVTGAGWELLIGLAAVATVVTLGVYAHLSFRKISNRWMDVLEALLLLSLPFAACFIMWLLVRVYELSPLATAVGPS